MKRATLEFNYEQAWKDIFGSNSNKVEVIEAIKCFKCDTQGLALICRIRLKDKNFKIKELQGKGLVTNIEVLYREKDRSFVVFIEGKSCIPSLPRNRKPFQVMMSRPPEFLDVDKMKVEVVGKQRDMQRFFNYETTMNLPSKLLGLSSLEPTQESHLAKLTSKQRQALLTAYALGYYEIPRKISSEELSKHLKIDKSTLVEHLRKAEKYIIRDIISE